MGGGGQEGRKGGGGYHTFIRLFVRCVLFYVLDMRCQIRSQTSDFIHIPGGGQDGWWCWGVLGQDHPPHFVQEPPRQLQHQVRDSLRCHSLRLFEARRPVYFGGMGDGADGPACRAALRAASAELGK